MNLKIIGILARELDREKDLDHETRQMVVALKDAFITITNEFGRLSNKLDGIDGNLQRLPKSALQAYAAAMVNKETK